MNLQTGIVYGPALTRRFGRALGVNLAPAARKACNFECAYCSSEWKAQPAPHDWPATDAILGAVERELATAGEIDTVLVAGNGEPTLHPAFAAIAEGLSKVSVRRAPAAALTLVSNGSTLKRLNVAYALRHFDARYVKLDAGDVTTFRIVNGPSVALARILADLQRVSRVRLISTFVKHAHGGGDNTAPGAIHAWLDAVRRVGPASVDVCTPNRALPAPFEAVPAAMLEDIADRVRGIGIRARVFA